MKLTLIPDTNVWRESNPTSEIFQLRDSGEFRIGICWEVALEAASTGKPPVSRAMCARMAKNSDALLANVEDVVRAFTSAAKSGARYPINPELNGELPKARKWLEGYCRDGNIDYANKVRKDRKKLEESVRHHTRECATSFNKETEEENFEHHTQIWGARKVALEFFNPAQIRKCGGAPLSGYLSEYGVSDCSIDAILSYVSYMRTQSGFGFYYFHLNYNVLRLLEDKSNSEKIDPSYLNDAKLLLFTSPNRILLTKDKNVLNSNKLLFNESAPHAIHPNDISEFLRARKSVA